MINKQYNPIVEVVLFLVIVAEVIFLIFWNHTYFNYYIDFMIVLLFVIAAYLAYRYLQITRHMPRRLNQIVNQNDYELMVERERRKKLDELCKTQQMKQFLKLKQSRLSNIRRSSIPQNKQDQQDQFIQELKQKEDQIFTNYSD